MKYILKTLVVPTLVLLTACDNNKQLSDAYGSFEASEVIISSETSGRVLQCLIDEGAAVKAGQVLYLSDSSAYCIQREQLLAQKQLTQTKNASVQAQIDVQVEQRKTFETDLERVQKMLKDGAATQKQTDDLEGKIAVTNRQIDQLKTQFTSINSELKVLVKQIENLDLQISKCTILAPRDGRIMKKYAEAGELLTPGKVLCKIADLDEIFIRVYVSGNQLPRIQSGQEVEVLAEDGKGGIKPYPATITWIAQEAEFTPKVIQTREERVNLVYAVKAVVKNDGALKIGMPGEMNFTKTKN